MVFFVVDLEVEGLPLLRLLSHLSLLSLAMFCLVSFNLQYLHVVCLIVLGLLLVDEDDGVFVLLAIGVTAAVAGLLGCCCLWLLQLSCRLTLIETRLSRRSLHGFGRGFKLDFVLNLHLSLLRHTLIILAHWPYFFFKLIAKVH